MDTDRTSQPSRALQARRGPLARARATGIAVGLASLLLPAEASGAAPQTDLQLGQALGVMECLGYSSEFLSIGEPRTIGDTQVARGGVVAASDLVFETGATLLFTNVASSKRDPECEGILYILADRLVGPPDEPAVVTWERERFEAPRFERGQAPAGASGISPGEPGSDGSVGAPGNAGFDGEHAPNLVILVGDVAGRLRLDFRGQDGGPGGRGQQGGNGGTGASGRPGVLSLFECKQGPERGGDGGDGGQGGRGGRGGNGGVGGTVIVIAPEDRAAAIQERLDVDLAGGESGVGGEPGSGGDPGRGGRGGTARALCGGSGDSGNLGSPGVSGERGPPGSPGMVGDFYLLALPPEQFEKVRELASGSSRRR